VTIQYLSNQRVLTRPVPAQPADALRALAASLSPDAANDAYGDGTIVHDLEAETARLLGKNAAIFALSGKVVQLAALRTHADARGRTVVAAHPRTHIVEDEDSAISALWGLRVARVGWMTDPFTRAELAAVREPLAAVTVELPLRRAGYRLTPWDELRGLAADARARGAAFHIDGARLWEAAPSYERSLAEIAALADTVYVSFYKGLGGFAGAALAGDVETIAAARQWIERAGSRVYRLWPYAAAAHEGLRRELPRMREYFAHAQRVAAALSAIEGVAVSPEPPQCNAFIVHLRGTHAALVAARDAYAERSGDRAFEHLAVTAHPDACSFELTIGASNAGIPPETFVNAVTAVVTRADSSSGDLHLGDAKRR
jgi:threonine aldolase